MVADKRRYQRSRVARNTGHYRKHAGRLHSEKHYTSKRPTHWVLHAMDFHNLTKNVDVLPNRGRGASWEWPILAGEISRNIPINLGMSARRETPLRHKEGFRVREHSRRHQK